MIPFAPLLIPAAAGFAGTSTVYTAVGSTNVAVPAGARTLVAEAISGGQAGTIGTKGKYGNGGAGGTYAVRTVTLANLSGLTAVTVAVPASGAAASVTGNDSASTVIVNAATGSGYKNSSEAGAVSTGDTVNLGGDGDGSGSGSNGGGAGGPNGAGGSAQNVAPAGAGGGGAAGSGGTTGSTQSATLNGSLYGGGGAGVVAANSISAGSGAQGWVKLTWS